MPLSRRRKKKGKTVRHNADKRAQRLEEADISAGVSLQDLINVLAYQEYEERGELPHQQVEDVISEGGPVAIAAINQVAKNNIMDLEVRDKKENDE